MSATSQGGPHLHVAASAHHWTAAILSLEDLHKSDGLVGLVLGVVLVQSGCVGCVGCVGHEGFFEQEGCFNR